MTYRQTNGRQTVTLHLSIVYSCSWRLKTTTMHKNLVKIKRLVREICSQPDIQTHTDVHITILTIALVDEFCYMTVRDALRRRRFQIISTWRGEQSVNQSHQYAVDKTDKLVYPSVLNDFYIRHLQVLIQIERNATSLCYSSSQRN